MRIFLAFAPFVVFAILNHSVGTTAALICAACVSVILLVRGLARRGRKIKVLDIGTFILFTGLAAYSTIGRHTWSIVGVRLCVDTGLLLIVLISLTIRTPFTLQYAREHTEREQWNTPAFICVNYVISTIWAVAFFIMVGADVVMLYLPTIPKQFGILVTILTFIGAIYFSSWYPKRLSHVE